MLLRKQTDKQKYKIRQNSTRTEKKIKPAYLFRKFPHKLDKFFGNIVRIPAFSENNVNFLTPINNHVRFFILPLTNSSEYLNI